MSEKIDFNSKIDMNKNGNQISAEEAVDAFMSGKGSLSQVKEDDDGTKHFFNVYGPVPDGLDHILNIFIDSNSLSSIFSAIANDKLKKPEKKEDNEYEGSQVTIDFTDEPIMWVLKDTKEKLCLDAYQRDEKKSFGIAGITNTWEKQDGNITITGEKIQEDNYLYYAAIFVSLANHLEAIGLVDELRKLNKYSGAGIVVSAKNEDSIAARVVQGKERPDLPCEVFLMGTITCRPYLDEMLAGARISNMSIEERIKAANAGDADAMESLAKAFLEGDGVLQDYKQSFSWWKKLAETGNATAQFNTGLYYAKGCGIKRDFAKAAEWMQRAADNGDEDAIDAVKAYKSADTNLQKAKSGDAAAQAELAKLYTQMGNSLEQLDADNDYKEAFNWAKKSADQGNADGLYILALCYEHGRGIGFDLEKSKAAYEKAAEQGHAPSQWNLACHYLRGFEDNDEKGLMLAYQSADQGYELAVSGIEQSGNTVEKLKEYYEDPERIISLEATQYEGRADRCERIHVGDELTYKIVKDKYGRNALEFFFKGGSVGLAYQHTIGKIIALLKLNRAKLKVTVRSCIPKSKRGARARNADVTLNMILTEIKPETPEERTVRLEKERIEREKRQEKERKEREARKKAEEEKRRAEEERRRQEEEKRRIEEEKARKAAEEARAKAEAERLAFEKEREDARNNQTRVITERNAEIEGKKEKDLLEQASAYNSEIEKIEAELSEKTAELNRYREELTASGGARGKRKKELSQLIQKGEASIALLSENKENASKANAERINQIEEKCEKEKTQVLEEVRVLYPIPETPEEREQRLKDEEKKRKEEEKAEKERLEKEKREKAEQEQKLADEKKRKTKKKALGIGACVIAAIAAVLIFIFVVRPEMKYKNAVSVMEGKDYDTAKSLFAELDGYKDSEDKIAEIDNTLAYKAAEDALANKEFDKAEKMFKDLGTFSDSSDRVNEVIEARNADLYKQAEDLLEEGDLDGAQAIFEKLGSYSDSEERVETIIEERNSGLYQEAETALKDRDYDKAEKVFKDLGDYSDSSERVQDVIDARNADTYQQASQYYDSGDYEKAKSLFEGLGNYNDAADRAADAHGKLNEALYAKAEGEFAAGDYKAAKNDYTALGDYSDAKEKAEQASAALAAQEEAAEIKSTWSDTLYFQSRQGGFFTFEFEWGQGASKPSVYFSDSAGRHSLSIKEMSKSKMVLSDSRGVTHTLTKRSTGGYNWQWQSTSGISFN